MVCRLAFKCNSVHVDAQDPPGLAIVLAAARGGGSSLPAATSARTRGQRQCAWPRTGPADLYGTWSCHVHGHDPNVWSRLSEWRNQKLCEEAYL